MRQPRPPVTSFFNSPIVRFIETMGAIALLIVYWLYVRRLEQLDFLNAPGQYVSLVIAPLASSPLLQQGMAFFLELFSWRVLRHFIPIMVSAYIARQTVIGFVWTFYGLPTLDDANLFFNSLRQTASTPAGGGNVNINRLTLSQDKERFPLLRVGGPGTLTIAESDVVVTERNGRFYRTLGPGRRPLHKLEYVRAVLDLRQQERSEKDVTLITRDGIVIRTDIRVTFRLRLQDTPSSNNAVVPSPTNPYPFGEDGVRLAAYAETVLEDDMIGSWEDLPLHETIFALRNLVSRENLDNLIYPELANPAHTTMQPQISLRNGVLADAGGVLFESGIELLEVNLGRLETDEEVTQQRIRYWQSYWERQALIGQADGEAEALRELALARAEAEALMLRSIVEGLEDAQQSGINASSQEIVALRLINSLDRMARQGQSGLAETDHVLSRIDSLRADIDAALPFSVEEHKGLDEAAS